MADLKQLKVKHDDDFAENDPLAELTRIMGGMPQATGAGEVDDDFGIDLERELMGELEQDLDPQARHSPQAEEPVSHEQPLTDLGPSFEDELTAEFSASLEAGEVMDGHDDAGQAAAPPAFDVVGARAPDVDDPDDAPAAVAPSVADLDEAAFVDMDFGVAEPPLRQAEPVSERRLDAGVTAPLSDGEPVHQDNGADRPVAAGARETAPAAAAEPVFDPFAELAAMASPPPAAPDPVGPVDFGGDRAETDTQPHRADDRSDGFVSDDLQDDVLAHMDLGSNPAAPRTGEPEQPFAFARTTPVAPPAQPEPTQPVWQDDDWVAQSDETRIAPHAVTQPDDDMNAADDAGWTQAQVERTEPDAAGWRHREPDQAATPVAYDERPAPQPETPRAEPVAAAGVAAGAGAAASALTGARAGFARSTEAPAIETVDVPESAVEIADDAGIPEFVQEDEPRLDLADELDMEFASAFDELNRDRPVASEPQSWSRATDAAALAAERRFSEEAAPEDFALGLDEADLALDETFDFGAPEQGDDGTAWRPDGFDDAAGQDDRAAEWPDEAYQVNASDDGELASAFYGEAPHAQGAAEAPPSSRRGLMIAALVAGVAVIGGISAFALSFGSGDPEAAPAMVKADPSPVKVRPETPGGVTVPNEDKIVYERVAGGDEPGTPTQEKLLSAAEEPVDLAVRDVTPAADAAAGKSEDRVAPETSDLPGVAGDEPALVAPRRVRTMIVRPDGTLVPREEPVEVAKAAEVEPAPAPVPAAAAPAPEPVAAAPAAPVVQNRDGGAASAGTAEEPAAPAQAEADSAPVRVVETTTIRQSGTQKVPDRGPVAPTRPSDQPVEIVGNTAQPNRQTEVTALDTRAPKPGEWSMQIASQPSPEGAQKSYANLSARYGSILKGRGVNIVKADIAGKGTFWRVRIPAGSRAEATRLCEQYKAAGGSCFVAK
ncbi:MAG: SPOR domain-containing protein [Nitratireductor sp.]